jgi:O-antigen/teichoic acid export membrane protein
VVNSGQGRGGRKASANALGRNTAIYLVGAVLQRGLAFLLLPFAARILGADGYGELGAGIAVAQVLAALLALGLNFSIVRLYYEEDEDAPATRWAMLLRLQILAGLILFVITFLLGPIWGGLFQQIGWSAILKGAVFYGALLSVQTTLLGLLRAFQRPVAFCVVSVSGVVVGGVLALTLAERQGPGGYLNGLAIGVAVSAVIGLILTRRRAIWDRAAIWPALVLSLPFIAHWMSGWVLGLSDRLIIERYESLTDLGRYTLAYTLASVLFLALDSAQSAWAPHYYGSLSHAAQRAVPGRIVVPMTVVAIGAVGILVNVLPAMVSAVAPDEFGYPALVIALVAAVAFVRVPYLLFMTALINAKRSRSIARASALAAVVSVGGNLVLVPRFGIAAAAFCTFVAFAAQGLLMVRAASPLLDPGLPVGHLVIACLTGVTLVVSLAGIPDEAAWWSLRVPLMLGLLAIVALASRAALKGYQMVVAGDRLSGP